ncbi:MAG: hypothetical protein F4092_02500 [Rhodospirillaceae bacterium]|nr:hypothetical protein [Rhodospirillaceae bacterium]MDE0253944.1 hypothetical protein [Rhodospirillaceae bacterium]MDE0616770.1 hypothetical protein [Rhodospirillaceae bacterium]MXY42163.1 hypothetical protein [Rhodospirillaceae bacterium]MYF86275.1 hypothetical protein [Rhodospirillaceae bacterium]
MAIKSPLNCRAVGNDYIPVSSEARMRHHIQTFEFNKRDSGGAQAAATKRRKAHKAVEGNAFSVK